MYEPPVFLLSKTNRKEKNTFQVYTFPQMINLDCGNSITKIWIGIVFLKYVYKLYRTFKRNCFIYRNSGVRGLRVKVGVVKPVLLNEMINQEN